MMAKGSYKMTEQVWYMAVCINCEPAFGMPFINSDERDEWASAHSVGVDHRVLIYTEKK